MKKTAKTSKHPKLSLNVETVRTLTNQELSLVLGGACNKSSAEKTVRRAGTEIITTC